METIDGTVRLPGGWDPAPGDQLRVTLEDVSRADARSTVLAEHHHALVDAAEQPFSLAYDPSAVDPRARLALRAQGLRGSALVLTSTQHIPAPAPGTATPVEIEVHEVPTARPSGSTTSAAGGSTDAPLPPSPS